MLDLQRACKKEVWTVSNWKITIQFRRPSRLFCEQRLLLIVVYGLSLRGKLRYCCLSILDVDVIGVVDFGVVDLSQVGLG